MTPYNVAQGFMRAREAERTAIIDPTPLLVIRVGETDFGFVTLGTGGTFTLQPAPQIPLGVQVTCNAQAAAITVEGTAINDGNYRTFRCILDNSNPPVRVWKLGSGG